jgi:multiple sugar transport system permease protein
VPTQPALGNYGQAFDLVDIPHQIRNSLIVVVAVPLTLLVASLAGFAMARLPPGRLGLVVAPFVALMVPTTALIVSRLAMFRAIGATDTFVPLVAPSLMGTSPFYVLLFYWSFRRIPVELYEAAELRAPDRWRCGGGWACPW